jgi:hypothetical protein
MSPFMTTVIERGVKAPVDVVPPVVEGAEADLDGSPDDPCDDDAVTVFCGADEVPPVAVHAASRAPRAALMSAARRWARIALLGSSSAGIIRGLQHCTERARWRVGSGGKGGDR